MPMLPKRSATVGVSRDKMARQREKREAGRGETTKRSSRVAMEGDGRGGGEIKIYEPAARLRGGPRDGFVYYVSDLEQSVRAAESMGKKFDYAPTRAKCTLPNTGGVDGIWWNWIGGL